MASLGLLTTFLRRQIWLTQPVSPQPVETKGSAFDLPNVPQITESPNSSAPSTPNDESQGHRRTGSVAIGNEDYFMSALRLRQDTKSAPGTPQGTLKRNATFSPRIVFYDTWPSQEYDRRGEIATCNRLTPMLAQQIKEELNNFKMVSSAMCFLPRSILPYANMHLQEMEVHENLKFTRTSSDDYDGRLKISRCILRLVSIPIEGCRTPTCI